VSYRLRHPIFIAMVSAPLALAAEPAVAAPADAAKAPSTPATTRPVDERARLVRLCGLVAASYDSARGGFVTKAGVPSESAV